MNHHVKNASRSETTRALMRRRALLLLTALLIAACLNGTLERDIQAVNSSSTIVYTVMNTSDSGAGSLRQAILDANANAGTDTIAFNISSGVQTISPLTQLPAITDPVLIDGATQPGFAGTPLIVISGNSVVGSGDVYGLHITAGNSTVRSIAINNFTNPAPQALRVDTNGGNTIQGCYIGVDPDGITRRRNYIGVIVNSDGNLIGGPLPSDRNVIAGSTFEQLAILGAVSNNEVRGNFIGTNAAGTVGLSDGSGEGVDLSGTGTGNVVRENLISGNGQAGISVGMSGSVIRGNVIGLNVTGTVAIPNFSGINLSGPDCLIGGTTPEERNIISGNNGSGIVATPFGTPLSRIQGNYIGTDPTGRLTLGNTGTGITVNFAPVIIGGTAPGSGNVISGNGGFGGIHVSLSNPGCTIQGNFIGTDATGTFALGNGGAFGIEISSSLTTIGGSQPGARNVISGNLTGIQIGGSTTATLTGNVIQGNFIGTDATGTRALPNTLRGINISAALTTTIGGTGPGAGNLIAFNNGTGIAISGSFDPSTSNLVSGNSIFLNAGLGIDLGASGVTGNDGCDADAGANNLQNFPVLTSADSNGPTTTINGALNSTANSTFTIEFFANPSTDATGFGEGKVFLGTKTVTTDGACLATFTATLTGHALGGTFITATATDSTNNTSEFSVGVKATGTSGKAQFDFDGDSRTDVSVFRPTQGTWYLLQSSNQIVRAVQFGISSDLITPADFDGDGKTDVAVWRPATGYWYSLESSSGAFRATVFGQNGDIPVPADFDGDGKSDICVFRPSTGTFYLLYSSNGSFHFQQWGQTGDTPIATDYDGDGKADFGIYRGPISTFYYLRSSDGGFRGFQWGENGDKPIAVDFDADGKTDIAVYRPTTGAWYAIRSSDDVFTGIGWGATGDIPAAGDYDGDQKADVAVFRPSSGVFYIRQSTNGSLRPEQFGTNGDIPTPSAYVP